MHNRILTTHAGSLPRSAVLAELHARHAAGETIDVGALQRESEAGERAAVAAQLDAGIDIINNGEAGRESFFTYVRHRMSGFSGSWNRPPVRDAVMFPAYLEQIVRVAATREHMVNAMLPPVASGEVRYLGDAAMAGECARLTAALAPHRDRYVEAFVSAPSPGIVATAMENRHYSSMADYVAALGRALAGEYRAVLDAGFILQIDAPDLALERHTLFADKPLADFLDFAGLVVDTINAALAGVPRDRVRLHVCWGNYNGPHVCDVALPEIWPVLARANVGGYLISMANPRHEHEVGMFSDGVLPADATLVAGVIDVTSSYVEHPEVVALRIQRAAAAVGDPRRVMAGTDCGFETTAGYIMVPADVAWAKMRALAEGAAIASRRLFG
jgi:5-methyltetrahydropteroyltriglutamate--homocysteine methyltransferase